MKILLVKKYDLVHRWIYPRDLAMSSSTSGFHRGRIGWLLIELPYSRARVPPPSWNDEWRYVCRQLERILEREINNVYSYM